MPSTPRKMSWRLVLPHLKEQEAVVVGSPPTSDEQEDVVEVSPPTSKKTRKMSWRLVLPHPVQGNEGEILPPSGL